MSGTFLARIGELRQRVPSGRLHASITVDQIYARYQLLRTDLRHPRGGTAHYLDNAMSARRSQPYADVAGALYAGGAVVAFTQGNVGIAQTSEQLTPIDTYLLRGSTSVTISHDGRVVAYRPPTYPRLGKEALKAWRQLHAQPAQRRTLEQGRRGGRGRIPR